MAFPDGHQALRSFGMCLEPGFGRVFSFLSDQPRLAVQYAPPMVMLEVAPQP
jgi:hypothetical protein